MSSFAESLPIEKRRRYRGLAVASALSGCISSQLVESSAFIVLFLTMLGGSESIAMFSSSIMSLSGILLLIPCASFAAKCGIRFTYGISCIAGFSGFCLIAAAPYLGTLGKYAVIVGCFIYTLTLNFYAAIWYPLLDNILIAEERAVFFSRMRFIYMLFNTVLLFLLGKFLGAKPPFWVFQSVFLVAGLGLLGRKFCMDQLPLDPDVPRESPDLRKTLPLCIHNRDLVGFFLYLCCLYFAFSAALPLALIYMKGVLHFSAGTVVVLTSINLAGKLAGFFLLGSFSKKCSILFQTVITHILALLAVGCLMFLARGASGMVVLAGTAFFILGIVIALLMCISAVEILALATPGNKIMATAFASTLIFIGTAGGTLLTSCLLKEGVLKNIWNFWGMEITKFQLLSGIFFTGTLLLLFFLPFVAKIVRKHDQGKRTP